MRKKVIITAAILVSLVLAFGAFQGVSAAEKKMKIKIPQCVCDNTDSTVRITLGRVDGIKSVETSPAGASATIVFDDTKTNFEQIRDILRREGVTVLGKPDYQD